MKKIYIFTLLLFSLFSNAQNGITYQAVILNPKGEELPGADNFRSPLVNKDICLRFKILKGSSLLEYQEIVTTTTDEFGMVNVVIGTGIQTDESASNFEAINWDGNPKNLVVELDITGSCSNFLEISNQPFTSVPYALYAANSGISGTTGPAGPQGIQGLKGDTGAQGIQGIQGLAGLIGAVGPIGPQGIQGLKGDTGAQGIQGLPGSNASITIGSISAVSSINGGTISSGVLNLTPADGSNGGVLTNGNQTISGNKTFNNNVTGNNTATSTIAGFAANINVQTNATYTLTGSDNGKIITFSNACTVTVPNTLFAGFNCFLLQAGAGQITIVGAGVTVNNRTAYNKTAGTYAIATILGLNATTFISSGDMSN